MKLNEFSGGLNIRRDPTLIGIGDATVYTNVDSAKGTLTSIDNYTDIEQRIDRWFHKFEDTWYSATNNREYLEYRGNLYWTEKDNYAQKVINGEVKKLGIDAPTEAILCALSSSDPILSSGTLQYTYTFVDSSDGTESPQAPLSEEIELLPNKSVLLTNIQVSANVNVDEINIYRVGADTTEFILIDTIDNGTVAYHDSVDPLDAPGDILAACDNQPPLLGIRYLTEAYGILFAADGSNLVFTSIGKTNCWPTANSIPIADDITGLYAISDGLIIFTLSKTYLLLGTTTTDFTLTKLSPEHGCLDHMSIAYVRNSLIWVASQGLCLLVSGAIIVVTKLKLGLVTFDPVKAVSYDEQYTLVLQDGSVFLADFRTGDPVFKYIEYVKEKIYNLGVFDNILYGSVDDKLVTIGTGQPIEFRYSSPRLTEGDASMTKLYNNVYVRANGTFIFEVLINGVSVSSSTLIGDTTHDIKVPEEKQRGEDIQFNIRGTGSIKEIEYKVTGRDNGR